MVPPFLYSPTAARWDHAHEHRSTDGDGIMLMNTMLMHIAALKSMFL